VFTDRAVETLQPLHADHDDQPGRRAGFGACVETDVSTTAKIYIGMEISKDVVIFYIILDYISIMTTEHIKVV
jgi:hypothetical protein